MFESSVAGMRVSATDRVSAAHRVCLNRVSIGSVSAMCCEIMRVSGIGRVYVGC